MPIYESAADREREQRVGARLVEIMGWDLIATATDASFDFLAVHAQHRELQALIEVKGRNLRYQDRPFYYVDDWKWNKLLWWSDLYGVPAFIVVEFTNGVAYVRVTDPEGLDKKVMGRTDRGDANDQSPAYCVPIDRLRNVKGMKLT